MLSTVFLFCAIIGGVIMICQFAMTLLGIGDDGGTFDIDPGGDFGGGDFGDGDFGDGFDGDLDASDHASHLFEVLSLQTLVTGITVFGLVGYIAAAKEQSTLISILAASAAGIAAIYGMYYLMRSIHRLQDDGTIQIRHAVGHRGSVLVPVPGGNSGTGKVSISLQGRLEEIAALTDYDGKLATGSQVEVTEVIGPHTVMVMPVIEEPVIEDPVATDDGANAEPTSSSEA